MKRRDFLVGASAGLGLGGAASMLANCAPGAPPDARAPQPGEWSWETVKSEFAVDPDLVHMASFCFDVDGMDPYDVVARLRSRRVVASVVPSFYRPLHVRLAPSLLTLDADVERAVAAVRASV